MIHAIYTLPEISFVGGESQTLLFNLLTLSGNDYDASECKVGFAVIHYTNKNGVPILTKDAEIKIGNNGIMNIAIVDLLPEDTIDLYGRFVYQITISDPAGFTEIPGQGLIDITRNIHPEFITNLE